MSLSDGGNYAQNWFANDGGAGQQVTQLIGQLTAMNIPVIAATGNSFTGSQGEGFAAIVAGTISVTATDLSGNLLSDAQRLGTAIGGASATTIAAPGEGLTAPSGDSGTATVEGTSFATALVTGGVTLAPGDLPVAVRQLCPPSPRSSPGSSKAATPINDPVTGITLGELNIPKAASLIPAPTPASSPPPGRHRRRSSCPPVSGRLAGFASRPRRRHDHEPAFRSTSTVSRSVRPGRPRFSGFARRQPTFDELLEAMSAVAGKPVRHSASLRDPGSDLERVTAGEMTVGLIVRDRDSRGDPDRRGGFYLRGGDREQRPGRREAADGKQAYSRTRGSWAQVVRQVRLGSRIGLREETVLAANLETALVTGAGSGIGRSIAATLADMGLRVALVGRDREKLERTRAACKGRDSAFVAACDIADRLAVKSLIDEVASALESIDVLVCNAGTNVRNRSLESLDPVDWDRMIATNLTGSFNLVHHVLPSMRHGETAWSFRSARCRASGPAHWEALATRRRSSARPRWVSAWDGKKGLAASARR